MIRLKIIFQFFVSTLILGVFCCASYLVGMIIINEDVFANTVIGATLLGITMILIYGIWTIIFDS